MKSLIPAAALILTAGLFNTACSTDTVSSKDVNAEAVDQNYVLSYDESTNSTWIYAQYRVGGSTGTTVELNDPANLKINGQTPSKSSFLGTSYELRQSGFVKSATFVYDTGSGQTLTNAIRIEPLILRKADQVLAVNAGYTALVDAPNLASNETVVASLVQEVQDGQGNSDFAIANGVYDAAHSQVTFSPSELNKLSNGIGKLQMERQKWAALSQATREGGGISATYALRPVSVTISGKLQQAPLARN